MEKCKHHDCQNQQTEQHKPFCGPHCEWHFKTYPPKATEKEITEALAITAENLDRISQINVKAGKVTTKYLPSNSLLMAFSLTEKKDHERKNLADFSKWLEIEYINRGTVYRTQMAHNNTTSLSLLLTDKYSHPRRDELISGLKVVDFTENRKKRETEKAAKAAKASQIPAQRMGPLLQIDSSDAIKNIEIINELLMGLMNRREATINEVCGLVEQYRENLRLKLDTKAKQNTFNNPTL